MSSSDTKGGAPQCLHPCPQQVHPSCPASRPALPHACSTGASGPPVSCHARVSRSMCRAAHTAGLHKQSQKSFSLHKQWRLSAIMPAALRFCDRVPGSLITCVLRSLVRSSGVMLRFCKTFYVHAAPTAGLHQQQKMSASQHINGHTPAPMSAARASSLSFKPASLAACVLCRPVMSSGIMPCVLKPSHVPGSPYCSLATTTPEVIGASPSPLYRHHVCTGIAVFCCGNQRACLSGLASWGDASCVQGLQTNLILLNCRIGLLSTP